MAKKPGVTTIASGYYSRAALNANFEALNNAFDNTVSRDGSTPNTMSANFDMNSNDITNANVIGANSLVVNGKLIAVSNDPVFDGTVTAFGASLIDDADAATARTTLGLGTAATASSTDFVNTTGVTSGNVTFADNSKAIFGAGSDLQIYHDGTTSIIKETGSGDLRLQGANIDFKDLSGQTYAYFNDTSGAVSLYHDNAVKFATTSTGCTVTGSIVADNVGSGSLAAVTPGGSTEANFTGIPADVRQVTVMFNELSMSGSDDLLIQLGDSGGIETSGYISRSVWTNASESTAGMIIRGQNAADKWTGSMTFTRVHTTNTFIQSHTVIDPDQNEQRVGAGSKTLSGELTQLKVKPSGSNTFDGGSVSITWSY